MEDLKNFINELENPESRISNHFQDRNMLILSLKELNSVIRNEKD